MRTAPRLSCQALASALFAANILGQTTHRKTDPIRRRLARLSVRAGKTPAIRIEFSGASHSLRCSQIVKQKTFTASPDDADVLAKELFVLSIKGTICPVKGKPDWEGDGHPSSFLKKALIHLSEMMRPKCGGVARNRATCHNP